MTDIAHTPAFGTRTTMGLRLRQALVRLRASTERWIVAVGTRRALDAMSDHMLRDIGLTRADIPYVVEAVARGHGDASLDPSGRVNRSVAGRSEVKPPASASWSERVVTSRTFYV